VGGPEDRFYQLQLLRRGGAFSSSAARADRLQVLGGFDFERRAQGSQKFFFCAGHGRGWQGNSVIARSFRPCKSRQVLQALAQVVQVASRDLQLLALATF